MAKKSQKTPDLRARRATDIIRHVGERGGAWLRLKNLDLTELPAEIFTLSDVEVIDLSGNKLRTIPKKLWNLPKLREVRLVGNPIEVLPPRSTVSIDLGTYRRCHTSLKPENINLVITRTVSEEDANWWLSELDAIKGPSKIIIGGLYAGIDMTPEEPTESMRKILDSLARLNFVGILLLRGLQIEGVPEG